MTPAEHARAKALFLEACQQPTEQRAAFLATACAGDDQLKLHVEELLAQHTAGAATDVPATQPARQSAAPPASASDTDERAFDPGTVIAGRYRIVSLLGRGGMGEVFRADDLVLAQPVALKFLPKLFAHDRPWLARLLQEARLAREVTHPNVCRVFDIHVSPADSETFISMEYVDGEDLSSLLRRAGRPAPERALELARQLCVGLAAAHARGVLHRDLKPANIMIDGRGDVRIMDFGLAAPRGQVDPREIRIGTPRYMAPELFAGTEVSIRSDIYALGLVLYELFTGQPAFQSDSYAELARLHQEVRPRRPAELVPEIDPAVERAIERCLEKDPQLRPADALAVASLLPGADVLALANAAGVTPSPSQVARAPLRTGLRPALAGGLLAAFLAVLAVVMLLAKPSGIDSRAERSKPPSVLRERAQQIAQELGATATGADEASGFSYHTSAAFLDAVSGPGPSSPYRLAVSEPNDFSFWYRWSPVELMPTDALNLTFGTGRVTLLDPPAAVPGMQTLVLDHGGRLLGFAAVPPLFRAPETTSPTPDWSQLLAAAEITADELTPVPPEQPPRVHADQRRAWLARRAGDAPPLRIEAASCWGAPVFFAVLESVPTPSSDALHLDLAWRTAMGIHARIILLVLATLGVIPLAWSNVRRGSSDKRGAVRLAAFAFTTRLVVWVLTAQHTLALSSAAVRLLFGLLGALTESALVGLFYTALEPYVRRYWPQTIVSWTRVLSGKVRDPLVGRDLLGGALLGVGGVLLVELDRLLVGWVGLEVREPLRLLDNLSPLLGPRPTLAACGQALLTALYLGLLLVVVLVLLRVLLRRTWVAAVGTVLVTAPMFLPQTGHPSVSWLPLGLVLALNVWAATRVGLLVVVCACFVGRLLLAFPLTFAPRAWTWDLTVFTLLAVLGLAVYGCITSTRATSPTGATAA